jgi:hypothetical protein
MMIRIQFEAGFWLDKPGYRYRNCWFNLNPIHILYVIEKDPEVPDSNPLIVMPDGLHL